MKKHKKSKSKRRHSTSSSSSCSQASPKPQGSNKSSKDETSLSRSTESEDLLAFISENSYGNSAKDAAKKKKLDEQQRIEEIYKKRELNPHLANNAGEKTAAADSSSSRFKITEANRDWLRKSFQRCVEMAKTDNISLLDLLKDRYSLEDCRTLLTEFGSKQMLHSLDNDQKIRSRQQNDEPSRRASVVKPSPAGACAEERYVTDEDINRMASQLLKAEINQNQVKAKKLGQNLEKMREAKRRGLKIRVTGSKAPASSSLQNNDAGEGAQEEKDGQFRADPALKRARREKFATHDDQGRRIAYSYEDTVDKSIKDMVREEKLSSARDSDLAFAKLSAKCRSNPEDEYGDAFSSNKTQSGNSAYVEQKSALDEYKRRNHATSSCLSCLERTPRHLVLSTGSRVFLRLPSYLGMCSQHCLLVPLEHVGAVTRLGDEVARELADFKRQLNLMCAKAGKVMIFMEIAHLPGSFKHHTVLECIPVPERDLDEAKMYFKKSLQETGFEWDQNKRLIELKSSSGANGPRGRIPQNFAYFSVEFGVHDGGYAKVLDDPQNLPAYFGREIIAGLLDLGPEYWRKPKEQDFSRLREKIVRFEQAWSPFDRWTTSKKANKKHRDPSSSNSDKPSSDEDGEGPEMPPGFVSN